MNTAKLLHQFRELGLMHGLDKARYAYFFLKNFGKNRRFRAVHPAVALPPNYVLFEAFNLDFEKYYLGGRTTAEWAATKLAPHLNLATARILDWGCGPARLVRHFPELLGSHAGIFATDYNPATIAWCKANISGVEFHLNQLEPPTDFADRSFDCILGISIFTHLSEASHRAWLAELHRLLDAGGVLFITTHGEAFRAKLTAEERSGFDANHLIVRGKVKEGHRVFTAFQPPSFFRELIAGKFEVLEHCPGKLAAWGIEQDLWILKKT